MSLRTVKVPKAAIGGCQTRENGGMSNESGSAGLPPEPQEPPALQANQPQAQPDATATVTSARVSLRRAPKYSVFLVLGGVAGALVTLVATALFPVDKSIGFAALFGYFVLYGIPIGVVFGALVAFAFDRISSRRAREVTAEQTTVDALPEAPSELSPDILPD